MRRCGRLLLGVLIACTVSFAHGAEEVGVQGLVQQLGDREFARREAAVRKLAERGTDAIDELVTAAKTESPEVASRAVQLLERLMGSEKPAAIDAADTALVELTESDRPHAIALAKAALERNALIREERAVAKIRALGGQVQYAEPTDEWGRPIANQAPPGEDEAASAPALVPKRIVLKRSWKGGIAGLSHLRKLSHVSMMHLYVVKGCGVPLAEAQSLASVLPGLEVNERGAYLGVQGIQSQDRCQIGKVSQGGPAAKAGLQADDVVVALNEQPVYRFNDLVEMLTERTEGEQVTITVQRHGEILDLDVQLEAWNLPDVADGDQGNVPPAGQPVPPPQLPQPRTPPPPQER